MDNDHSALLITIKLKGTVVSYHNQTHKDSVLTVLFTTVHRQGQKYKHNLVKSINAYDAMVKHQFCERVEQVCCKCVASSFARLQDNCSICVVFISWYH